MKDRRLKEAEEDMMIAHIDYEDNAGSNHSKKFWDVFASKREYWRELKKEQTKRINIMNYRKKPVEIQAMQLKETNIREVYEFIYSSPIDSSSDKARDSWEQYENSVKKNGLKLKTLESDKETQTASINDYIIRGVQGEYYPCKPDIFIQTYDAI